jgi:hypothetical protein
MKHLEEFYRPGKPLFVITFYYAQLCDPLNKMIKDRNNKKLAWTEALMLNYDDLQRAITNCQFPF